MIANLQKQLQAAEEKAEADWEEYERHRLEEQELHKMKGELERIRKLGAEEIEEKLMEEHY